MTSKLPRTSQQKLSHESCQFLLAFRTIRENSVQSAEHLSGERQCIVSMTGETYHLPQLVWPSRHIICLRQVTSTLPLSTSPNKTKPQLLIIQTHGEYINPQLHHVGARRYWKHWLCNSELPVESSTPFSDKSRCP